MSSIQAIGLAASAYQGLNNPNAMASIGRAKNRTIAFVGDSWIARGWDTTSATTPYSSNSVGLNFWTQFFSKSAAYCPPELNFGAGGFSSWNCLNSPSSSASSPPSQPVGGWSTNSVDAACASLAGTIVLNIGTNDRATSGTTVDPNLPYTISQSIGFANQIMSKLLTAGKCVIVVVPSPRRSPFSLTGDQLSYHVALGNWWRGTWGMDPRVQIVDMWPMWSDPSTGAASTSVMDDGLHPNCADACLLGQYIAAAHDRFCTPIDLGSGNSNGGVWTANNNYGNLLPNGAMYGTGGGLSGGATGLAPPYCTLDLSNASGGTLAGSQVSDGFYGQYQRLTIGGSPTAAQSGGAGQAYYQLRQLCITNSYQAGDTLEFLAYVAMQAGQTNIRSITASLFVTYSGGSVSINAGTQDFSNASNMKYPNTAISGWLRTNRYTLKDTPTSISARINIYSAGASSANSAVIDTGKWMVRKVIQ